MFQDFDYISPEMSARFDSADEKKDPSTNILPDEMQELRIRGFGPWAKKKKKNEWAKMVFFWFFCTKKKTEKNNQQPHAISKCHIKILLWILSIF